MVLLPHIFKGGDRFASGLHCLFRAVGFGKDEAAWMVNDLDSINMHAHPETADLIGKSGSSFGVYHHSGHGAVDKEVHRMFNATLHRDALIAPVLRMVQDVLDKAQRPCG